MFQNTGHGGAGLAMNDDIRQVIIRGWIAVDDHQFCFTSLCHQRHGGSGLDNEGGPYDNEKITQGRKLPESPSLA